MPTESMTPTNEQATTPETIAQRVARLRQHFAADAVPEAHDEGGEGGWDNWTQWDQWNQFHNVI